MITKQDKFEACILCGAIGDAWGSSYENDDNDDDKSVYYWGGKKQKIRSWSITDDTQLTLATCEALCDKNEFSAELLSTYFVKYYKQKKIKGIGASTLKDILELDAGAYWSQAGRQGEYAAGNGAAMRIAPLAFFEKISREDIRNACRITHKNDEAYTGALAVTLAIRAILSNEWNGENNLFEILIPQLPDTNVRDRLIEINMANANSSIADIAKTGTNGYVVNSVPFAIFSATQVVKIGVAKMFEQVISAGGDTDTNASIAGQLAGALVGKDNITKELLDKLKALEEYEWIKGIINKTKEQLIPII